MPTRSSEQRQRYRQVMKQQKCIQSTDMLGAPHHCTLIVHSPLGNKKIILALNPQSLPANANHYNSSVGCIDQKLALLANQAWNSSAAAKGMTYTGWIGIRRSSSSKTSLSRPLAPVGMVRDEVHPKAAVVELRWSFDSELEK